MSSEQQRIQHSRRRYDDVVHIRKRQKLLKAKSILTDETMRQPHRLHKVNGINCGNSNCVMCGNPRKIFKELSIQERRMYQDVEVEEVISDNSP